MQHRWPTVLGIAVAGIAGFDVDSALEFATLVIVMALVYLGAAVLDRRWSAWVLLPGGFAVIIVLRLLDLGVDPSVGLLIIACAFLVVGVVRQLWRGPRDFTLQVAGMVVFGGTAPVALYATPALGGYLVAAALLGHAAWDAVHFRRNQVVVRSYAEFCAVVDLLLSTVIIVTLGIQ